MIQALIALECRLKLNSIQFKFKIYIAMQNKEEQVQVAYFSNNEILANANLHEADPSN